MKLNSIPALLRVARGKLSLFDCPQLEAMVLMGFVSGFSKERLMAMDNESLPPHEEALFWDVVQRRVSGEPSAYLTGVREFYGRELTVSRDVLIPRPDTEILVEEALRLIREKHYGRVWDLCTGSSAIILSICAELLDNPTLLPLPPTDYHFFASDISEKALTIAKKNIDRYNLPIKLFQGSLFDAMPKGKTVDLIATNPPYLENQECDEKITQGWREPDLALRGGDDGLDLIKIIIKEALDKLNYKGYLLIEASGDQMDSIEQELFKKGYISIYRVKDLASIERVICGQKP